ncbi:MAG: elongation factor P [Bacteroidales bacterium]|nr:elongation factor P [Bacteroidales bacterium]
MATTADFRNGLCIEFNGELWTIFEFQHVKPGKGPAFVRTKLKNVKTGRVIPNTFTSGVKINIQRIERRPYQYLYKEGQDYHFMNTETFEQFFIEENLISAPDLLKEGDIVTIAFHAETESPIECEMPAYVTLEVTYTEPGEKGNTATNTFKDATLETDAIVKVPLFINIGDKIKVDTRTHEYSERVKE